MCALVDGEWGVLVERIVNSDEPSVHPDAIARRHCELASSLVTITREQVHYSGATELHLPQADREAVTG